MSLDNKGIDGKSVVEKVEEYFASVSPIEEVAVVPEPTPEWQLVILSSAEEKREIVFDTHDQDLAYGFQKYGSLTVYYNADPFQFRLRVSQVYDFWAVYNYVNSFHRRV